MIDILIPTYNRCPYLLKNLKLLSEEIVRCNLVSVVGILISDNDSSDDTEHVINLYLNNSNSVNICYSKQKQNKGLEMNAVDLLKKSKAQYVMFLGDDDFLPNGYLQFCIDVLLNDTTVGSIIPGLSSLKSNGTVIEGRKEKFEIERYAKGYQSVYRFSHLGHQMSGVVLKKESLLADYLSFPQYRNIYLFIYFLANRILDFKGVYAPKFKILVSVENIKNWSYNEIGLLDEVFKSYYPFIGQLRESKVSDLMIRFTIMHSYRLNFDQKFYACFNSIATSVENISGFKRKLFVMLMKEYLLQKISGTKE